MPVNAEGPVNWDLSVKYDCNHATGAVSAYQHLYIDKLLKKWGMEQCYTISTKGRRYRQGIRRAGSTPRRESRQRLPNSSRQFPLFAISHFSRNIMGSLCAMKIHDMTRPYSSDDSKETAFVTLKGARTYLYDDARNIAPAHTCQIRSTDTLRHPLPTQSHIDKSSVGYVFLLNGGVISWRASRTTQIVLNAVEAELYYLSSATQEAMYVCKVSIELGFLQNSSTIMDKDYQATVALSKENRFCRNKHISLHWSLVVERQKSCHQRHSHCRY